MSVCFVYLVNRPAVCMLKDGSQKRLDKTARSGYKQNIGPIAQSVRALDS